MRKNYKKTKQADQKSGKVVGYETYMKESWQKNRKRYSELSNSNRKL